MLVKSKSRLREHGQGRLAKLAILASWLSAGLFTRKGIAPNLIALLIADRPAMIGFLASVNAPPAAAKVVSHGDVLPSMGSELRRGQPLAFSEMACDLGENQRERRCQTSFFKVSSP